MKLFDISDAKIPSTTICFGGDFCFIEAPFDGFVTSNLSFDRVTRGLGFTIFNVSAGDNHIYGEDIWGLEEDAPFFFLFQDEYELVLLLK